ncbi:hypothetical protein KYX15_16755, partial [Pseudomonas aeruginosa]|uniref:hypothetical protein n=1 Tax=Pseudomonas aeruginosa TaxID=287 RepID=UPI001C563E46
LKSVIVPSVQSPPSMLKLHDFCNRARSGAERGRAAHAYERRFAMKVPDWLPFCVPRADVSGNLSQK